MKTRIAFFVSILFLISFSLKAQKFTWGLSLGYDIATIDFRDAPDDAHGYFSQFTPLGEQRSAFNVNAYLGYDLNEKIGISLEPGFIRKGCASDYMSSSDRVLNLNYIQMPVLLSYAPIAKLKFYIGPEFAYLYSVRGSTAYPDNLIDVKKFDIAGNIGLGYTFFDHFELGTKFSYSFLPFDEVPFTSATGTPSGMKVLSRYAQLFIRYKM